MYFDGAGYSWRQFDPTELRITAKRIAKTVPDILKRLGADAVAVTGKSGLSLIFAAQALAETPFPIITVRKRGELSHGAAVEGTPGIAVRRYIIIDDFVQSGSTVANIVDALRALDEAVYDDPADIAQCVGVFQYNHRPLGHWMDTRELRTVNGIPLFHI